MINAVLLTVSIISLTLGIFVLTKNAKDKSSVLYSIFAMLMALWTFGMFMYAKDPPDYSRIISWSKILHAAGLGISMSLFLFALAFTKNKIISSRISTLALIPGFFVIYLALATNSIINSLNFLPGNRQLVYGQNYPWYFALFTIYITTAIVFLITDYLRSSGIYRQQLKYIIIGISIPSCFAFIINLILPSMGNFKIAWSGPIFLLIENACIGYAILKFKALNVKALVSEIMALLLSVIVFTWLISNFNLMNFLFFFFVCILSIILIRSVALEARKEEELADANRQLAKDKKELVELDRMKDEFLMMATHELRTPVTAIKGRLDMAVRENLYHLDNKQMKFLEPTLDEVERLSNLSNDILNTARIDQHRLALNASETNLDALIAQIVSSLEIKAKERGNSIGYIPMSKELPKINMDQSKIGEVISNLVNNAIKFTENGKIAVTSKLKDNEVVVSVADTGIGIEKEDQKHLFQKFYQAGRFDKDEPQEQQGTGLGLYISKNIIELHGGKMWLESDKGKGSTFYFSLPLEYREVKQPAKLHGTELTTRVL